MSIELFRSRHQVRPLDPGEEGVPVERLPAGVYGFTYAPGFDAVPLFAKKSYHAFEVHRASDGVVHLLGFVTDREMAQLESGQEGLVIRLFPDPWGDSACLVSVPASQVHAPKRGLPREDGNPLPLTTL